MQNKVAVCSCYGVILMGAYLRAVGYDRVKVVERVYCVHDYLNAVLVKSRAVAMN